MNVSFGNINRSLAKSYSSSLAKFLINDLKIDISAPIPLIKFGRINLVEIYRSHVIYRTAKRIRLGKELIRTILRERGHVPTDGFKVVQGS